MLTAVRVDSPLTCDREVCGGGAGFQLLPGHSFQAQWTLKVSQPMLFRSATAEVDPLNRCSESSELNNSASSPAIQVIRRPNLKITGHRPTRYTGQGVAGFPVTIENVGSGVATDVTVKYSVPNPTNPIQFHRIDRVYFGPFVDLSITSSPPLLPRTCDLTDGQSGAQSCNVAVRLGPHEMIQLYMVKEDCPGTRGGVIRISTGDDSTPVHRFDLHSTCNLL